MQIQRDALESEVVAFLAGFGWKLAWERGPPINFITLNQIVIKITLVQLELLKLAPRYRSICDLYVT